MSRNHNFVDHTADIAVELSGDSLEELFISGADAWLEAVLSKKISEDNDSLEVDLSASSKEELLVTFLNELNFLFTTKKWLCLKVVSIKIIEDDTWELSAELNGIKGEDNFQFKQEIKSVTYHQMEIVNKDGKFSTLVVFDI